jgi:hypothetical protein
MSVRLTHHLGAAVILIVATALYLAGFVGAGVAFLAAAVLLDTVFWVRLVRARASSRLRSQRAPS